MTTRTDGKSSRNVTRKFGRGVVRSALRAFAIGLIMIGVETGGEVESVCAQVTGSPSGNSTSYDGGAKLVAQGPKKVILKVDYSFGTGTALDGDVQILVMSGTYEEDSSSTPTLLIEIDLPAGVSIYERNGQQYMQYDGAQAVAIKGSPLFPGSLTDSKNSSSTGGANLNAWYNLGASGQSGTSTSTMQGKDVPNWLGEQLVNEGIISGFSFLLTPYGSQSALMLNDFIDQVDVSPEGRPKATIASSLMMASQVYTEYAKTYIQFQTLWNKRHPSHLADLEASADATPERMGRAIALVKRQIEYQQRKKEEEAKAQINARIEGSQYN